MQTLNNMHVECIVRRSMNVKPVKPSLYFNIVGSPDLHAGSQGFGKIQDGRPALGMHWLALLLVAV